MSKWRGRATRSHESDTLPLPITAEPLSSSSIFSAIYHFSPHLVTPLSPYLQSEEIARSSIREPIQPSRHTGPRRATFACDGMSAGYISSRAPRRAGHSSDSPPRGLIRAARKAFLNAPTDFYHAISRDSAKAWGPRPGLCPLVWRYHHPYRYTSDRWRTRKTVISSGTI